MNTSTDTTIDTAIELPAGFIPVDQELPKDDRAVLAIRLSGYVTSRFEVLTAHYAPKRSQAYPWQTTAWDNVGDSGAEILGWKYADWLTEAPKSLAPPVLQQKAEAAVESLHQVLAEIHYDCFPTLEAYTGFIEGTIGALKIFDVVAGKIEQDFDTGLAERNYKVSHSDLTIAEAVELFRECQSYPFCEILVGGQVLYAA